jgi:hypothetical protein
MSTIVTAALHHEFAKSAHPVNWYKVAKLIHENAHTLHSSPQGVISYGDGVRMTTRRTSNRSVFLLAAFALENLIKAFLISTSAERETEERSVTPELWSEYNRVFDLYSQRLEFLLSKRWRGPYGDVSTVVFAGR